MPNLTDYIDRIPTTVKQDLESTFGFGIRKTFQKEGLKAAGMHAAFGPGLIGLSAYQDYREGGIGQAVQGVASNAGLEMGARTLMRYGGHAAGAGWRSAGMGLLRGGSRLMLNPYVAAGAITLGAIAATAGTMYVAGNASWQYHLNQLPLETTGSLSAFQTSSAATMRQRSMMNIQRSHLNARSAFGNEAEWAHLARYRGVGRRGTR